MKKAIQLSFVLLLLALVWNACQQQQKSSQEAKKVSDTVATTAIDSESCVKTGIKDPNNPKPMALMMRAMAANMDSMRAQLLRGESLDSLRYPFIRFYLAEPTDPTVLEPQFYENARLFQQSYHQVFKHPKEQKKYYNLLVNACIHCHESYCSGPLKRIRKFPIQ